MRSTHLGEVRNYLYKTASFRINQGVFIVCSYCATIIIMLTYSKAVFQ